jgi:hypothetical protein
VNETRNEVRSVTVGLPNAPKEDSRPKKNLWAPGGYYCKCEQCCEEFIGDKRALICADCAYSETQEQTKPNWQPIETVPKDGSKVDLLYPYPRGRTIDCEWRQGDVHGDGRWCWLKPLWGSQPGLGIDWHLLPESEWEVCSYPNLDPTHWMRPPPLPAQVQS